MIMFSQEQKDALVAELKQLIADDVNTIAKAIRRLIRHMAPVDDDALNELVYCQKLMTQIIEKYNAK